MTADADITIRRATAAELIDLRHAVLRHGFPREAATFPGDDDTTARHFAALCDGEIVGCVTMHQSEWDGEPAWQVRGMAVAPNLRNGGIGLRLLAAAETSVRDDPGAPRLMWCNARIPASGFYIKSGWRIVSEPFDIPASGPHVKMIKRLG